MKITEIIKDAFLFPSKNSGRYSIYLLLSVLISLFAFGGVLTYALGIIDAQNYLIGGLYLEAYLHRTQWTSLPRLGALLLNCMKIL